MLNDEELRLLQTASPEQLIQVAEATATATRLLKDHSEDRLPDVIRKLVELLGKKQGAGAGTTRIDDAGEGQIDQAD